VAARKTPTPDPTSDARDDEAWIRAPGGEISIRIRSLTNYLGKGGRVLDARFHQGEDGVWSLWLRLADRPGEFRLNHFHADEPKTWIDLNLAIANLQDAYGYFGGITLTTDRRTPAKA
jgi:hypothetical protein